jgi:GNAT superfamily N-acetyltransferase
MFTIRPFAKCDKDYEAITAVWNAAWPEFKHTPHEFKSWDERRNPTYYFHRELVEENGRVVAFGTYNETWWTEVPGQYYIECVVHHDHKARGIGSCYYDHVMAILAERDDLQCLMAEAREDKEDALQFLKERGFKPVMRFPLSELDVAAFDPAPYQHIPDKVRQHGIVINTLAQLSRSDPDWLQKLYDIKWAIVQDIPLPDEPKRQPCEEFVKFQQAPGYTPEAMFIALDGDQYVGLSELWKAEADPQKLNTGLTGVIRSHRRLSIATALKLCAIEFAQGYGAERLETDNEENNPMFQLNLQLGFKPLPAFLDLKKEVV